MDSRERLVDVLLLFSSGISLPFEKKFHFNGPVEFARAHVAIPVAVGACYLALCFIGVKLMSNMKPFDLRVPLAIWNAILCTFCFIGMCRTVPVLLASIISQDYQSTVCSSPAENWANGVTGFWVMLFIFSKLAMLVDTMFIILRKKPLIFLHWYHHVTVLLFSWNAYATLAGSGLYFVAMGYTVHVLMYGYYCLQALGIPPKNFPTFLITFAQIGQMLVGTAVCVSAWYFTRAGANCHTNRSNLAAGGLMYGSYIYLFADFAVNKMSAANKKRAGKPQKVV